ncbi:hypothetical protein MMC12_007098 [Toensbergia leucococca]|nr:hypothetical protein [Toensbergia leucococca]
MAFINSMTYIAFICSVLFLTFAASDLTGTLIASCENKEIITVLIKNTGKVGISVHTRNNVFDSYGNPHVFIITDEAGRSIATPSENHLFVDTVEGKLLYLAPGKEYERPFNMTEYIDFEPDEKTIQETITISLFPTVLGVEGEAPPLTGNILINQQPRNGLLSNTDLSEIPLNSDALNLTWAINTRPASLKPRQFAPKRGIQFLPGECKGPDIQTMKNAILDASYLASAGINAAASFADPPFNYFFNPSLETSTTVAGVLHRVISSQLGNSQLIGVSCNDTWSHCGKSTGRNSFTGAYTVQDPMLNRAPVIILCPTALALPRNPTPCTVPPGTITLGWTMLEQLVQIYSISGPGLDVRQLARLTAADVGNSVKAGEDTTMDARAYSYLGSWAWDLGLGGPPWDQRILCLRNFNAGLFNIFTQG